MQAVDLADVVNAADVGVGDGARDADLVDHAIEADAVVGEVWWEKLEGDGLHELEVVGAEDLAHAALAELADDAESIAQDVAGVEAPFGQAGGAVEEGRGPRGLGRGGGG